jgi:uncharacterized membrane protein YvlD (DUF360 family)
MLRTWLIFSLAVWLTTFVVPQFKVRGFWDAMVVSAIFGVLNVLVGWLISLVFIVGTLGVGFFLMFLTTWFTNAVVLEMTEAVTDRVKIGNFGSALAAGALISIFGHGAQWLLAGH